MTAEEMFKELGYVKNDRLVYVKTNADLMTKQFVKFDEELKSVSLVKLVFNKRNGWFKCRDDFETKDYKIFSAIQKQLAELGWRF